MISKQIHQLFLFILLLFSSISFAQKKDNTLQKPVIKEIYFEDRNNNKIDENRRITLADEFYYLVVVSTNAQGEKITIKMDEGDEPVIFRGKYIGTYESFNFKIKEDIERIKLTIYNSNIKRHQKLKSIATGTEMGPRVKKAKSVKQ